MNARAPHLMERDVAAALLRQVGSAPPGHIAVGPPGMNGPGTHEEPALIHEPGGDVMRRLEHPAFTTLERLRRIGPPATGSWFNPSVSPTNPVQFDILSFEVPRGQQAWIFDYSFSVYRQSGVDPADLIKAEDGRFANQIGFDVQVDGARIGAIQYGLIPIPQPTLRPQFSSVTSQAPSTINPNDYAGPASQGLSLLPSREGVAGARGAPFTIIANEGQRVNLSCVIFRRLRSAVGAIEGRIGGYLLASNFATALVNRMRPR
jgi:hypothetical protein